MGDIAVSMTSRNPHSHRVCNVVGLILQDALELVHKLVKLAGS